MGAISDNITNVSTVGYKNTNINFQTLVTKQTSTTFYSAGGVQSRPRQAVDVQGLLQASTSQTDIGLSGGGFFVVNGANTPGTSDPYFYTRAGSFKLDNEGFLTNSAGYYLQAWPTDAAGNVIPANSNLTQTNLNVISSDYVETVNLSRVSGSAAATTEIAIGANLPANAAVGDSHRTDAQFFDSLGQARTVSFQYTKFGENQWDLTLNPPQGTSVVSTYDASGNAYDSIGQLEFNSRPADGSQVTIEGITYEFDSKSFAWQTASVANNLTVSRSTFSANYTTSNVVAPAADRVTSSVVGQFSGLSVGEEVTLRAGFTDVGTSGTITAVDPAGTWIEFADGTFATDEGPVAAIVEQTTGGGTSLADRINANAGTFSGLVAGDVVTMTNFTTGGNNVSATITAVAADGSYIEFADGTLANNETMTATAAVTFFNGGVGETATLKRVNVSASTTVALDVDALVAAVIANDTDFDTINNRIQEDPDNSNIIIFHEDGTRAITVDPSGLLDSNGAAATTQTASFTVQQIYADYAPYSQLVFNNVPANGETIVINGVTYTFDTTGTETAADNDTTIDASVSVAAMLTDLEGAIEANDPNYAIGGTSVRIRENSNSGANDTLVLTALNTGAYTINFAGQTTAGVVSDINGTDLAQGTLTVQALQAINFDSQGNPSSFNVTSVEVTGFDNGAADMDSVSSNRMAVDFGTIGGKNGMTQSGTEFTPSFTQQNGSRFGTFAGVSISPDGLVTALFDNGDTRPIYQIPVATFTNPNGLEGQSGNVWNASEASGDYTLRTAGNGPAGVITQGALEASTVDIGAEFTTMIVVQRAYSASTKIISTADQMLEELMRTKR
jgi:flagellar hook protein FlgE